MLPLSVGGQGGGKPRPYPVRSDAGVVGDQGGGKPRPYPVRNDAGVTSAKALFQSRTKRSRPKRSRAIARAFLPSLAASSRSDSRKRICSINSSISQEINPFSPCKM